MEATFADAVVDALDLQAAQCSLTIEAKNSNLGYFPIFHFQDFRVDDFWLSDRFNAAHFNVCEGGLSFQFSHWIVRRRPESLR